LAGGIVCWFGGDVGNEWCTGSLVGLVWNFS
jgi:hypothetical protein